LQVYKKKKKTQRKPQLIKKKGFLVAFNRIKIFSLRSIFRTLAVAEVTPSRQKK